MAEENGEIIGYVASQTVPFMHGFNRLLWIEYVVVKSDQRRKGVATALLQHLFMYAKNSQIDRIYTTINPDNEASIKLHQKVGFNVKNWKVAALPVDSGLSSPGDLWSRIKAHKRRGVSPKKLEKELQRLDSAAS